MSARVSVAYGPCPKPAGLMVRHLCGCSGCVRPSHLATGTSADNGKDMAEMFTSASSLGPDDVRGIRAAYADGVPLRAIAERYGIAFGSVYPIVIGQNFRHLSGGEARALRSPRKLDAAKAAEIRRRCFAGERQSDLAREFSVATSLISRVVTGVRWPNA